MVASIHKQRAKGENARSLMGRWHAALSREVAKQELGDLKEDRQRAIRAGDADGFEKATYEIILTEGVLKMRDCMKPTEWFDGAFGTTRDRGPHKSPDARNRGNLTKNRTGLPTFQDNHKWGDVGVVRAAADSCLLALRVAGHGEWLYPAPTGEDDDRRETPQNFKLPFPLPQVFFVTGLAADAVSVVGIATTKLAAQVAAAPSAVVKQSTNTVTRLALMPYAKRHAREERKKFERLLKVRAASARARAARAQVQNSAE